MSGSRSSTWSAWRLERATQPYWGILPQKWPKNGWGGNSGSSTPWDIARGGVLHLWRDRGGLDGVNKANCCKGGQAVLLFLRRCPLRAQAAEQGWGEGDVPFAAPLCRQSPRSHPRGSARMSAFPRPLLALHPRRQEPGREECVARRGRSSRRRDGRDIRRMAGRAPSWCSLDLGLGPPGGEIALARVARPGAPVLFRPEPGGWPGAGGLGRQRPGSGSKRPRGRPSTGIPWPGLSRSPTPSVCQRQREESRRLSSRIRPCLTRRRRRTHQGPFRAPALPTHNRPRRLLGADVARERLYPRKSHLRPLGMSATLSVWVRRMASTASRVCCDFSSYRLYPAASWERRSSSSARRRCSSSYCRCSASSRAQARRRQFSAFAESRICWRFSRFLVESVEISRSCAISGTSWRRKVEISLPIAWLLLALQTHETEIKGCRRFPGFWTVWMQLCRSFASRQDCACIGVLGIESERFQLYALLVGSQNVDPEDGACAEPGRPRPILRPSPMFPLCLRVPWLAGPRLPRPACCRVRAPGYEYRAPRPVG